MSIDSVGAKFAQFASIRPPQPVIEEAPRVSDKIQSTDRNGQSFGEVFSKAINEVDQLQKEADQQIEGLVLGKEGATTHGAMIALEKADVAFQLMTNIRAKIVRAYEEVMRTQV